MEYHKNTAGVVRDLDQVKRSAPELLPLFQDWVGAYMAGFTMRIPSELKQGYIDFKSSLAPSNILKSQAQQYTEIFTQVVRDTCLPLSEYANR